ncbi:MAG: leucyl/phenylalanyl-tRNA--protein transferase [Fimbriimonadaceae bacterium]|nr:leucyl/phenylalanyl-tRNA--protein transferase [Fimbriimonadaceae bacterium]
MLGETLTPWTVDRAYRKGYFVMGDGKEGPAYFYSTSLRAMLPIEGIRISRSLRRSLNKSCLLGAGDSCPKGPGLVVTFDRAFEAVMRGCQRDEKVWITEEIIRVWTLIHQEGWGHSCEVWKEGELVGGVYGVAIGACFCGESMFHRATDASKVALHFLLGKLRTLGFQMFDCQFINEHTRSLGAYEITQDEFLRRLRSVEHREIVWG